MYPEPLAGWRGEGPAEGRENKFQILMEPDSEEVIDDVTEGLQMVLLEFKMCLS